VFREITKGALNNNNLSKSVDSKRHLSGEHNSSEDNRGKLPIDEVSDRKDTCQVNIIVPKTDKVSFPLTKLVTEDPPVR
jgi:hypothetical protein